MNLTKSDFKVARTCPTKLYYKKLRYPSLDDENPYLEFLADGGYMVEAMAKLLFPDGKELGNWAEPAKAFAEIRQLLESGDGTFFEATIVHDNWLARVDILRRVGGTLHLIEVKSSSIDSHADGANPFRGKKGGIFSEWRPYLEDVTFQVIVLDRAFPQFRVVPFLCVVDKSVSATDDSTYDKFELRKSKDEWRPDVNYLGNVDELRKSHVLKIIDVSSEVQELKAEVERDAAKFAASLKSDPIFRIAPEIGKKCKRCEYRLPLSQGGHNGFRNCWEAMAEPDPHILDLYRVDLFGGKNNDLVAKFTADGKAKLSDVSPALLSGAFAARQNLQLECSAAAKEYIAPALRQILQRNPAPLHFIDFEGSRLAIPYHSGMRPYEQAAFQWSCHTISALGSEIEHNEWLNTENAFPNFDFASALKEQVGSEGTVYIWSHYELDILREIRRQMEKYNYANAELAQWIDQFTVAGNPRIVDLYVLAQEHYFHPLMKGNVSIKNVLPAVWKSNSNLQTNPLFKKYLKYDDAGALLDPYETLPPLPIGEAEEVVNEGTGAMRVYQEMMFGRAKNDTALRDGYKKLLLQYCELDTAAMVAIWMHWAK